MGQLSASQSQLEFGSPTGEFSSPPPPTLGSATAHIASAILDKPGEIESLAMEVWIGLILLPFAVLWRVIHEVLKRRRKIAADRADQVTRQDALPAVRR